MLETFKARLKTKYSGVNLSTKRIDAIADRLHKKFPDLTEEADHDAKLDDLNDLQPFADIAKDDDRIRTLENKPKDKEKDQPADPKKDDPAPTPKPEDAPPAWAQALIDQNKALAEKLEGIEKEKSQMTISQKLAANPKLEGVPEVFWKKRSLPQKEEDIEAFVTEASADWAEVSPVLPAGVKPPTNVKNQAGSKTATEAELDEVFGKIK